MNRKVLFKLVCPEGWSLAFASFALSILLAGLLISILAPSETPDETSDSIGLFLIFIIPLTFVCTFIAALASRQAGPRFALGSLTFLLVVADAIAISIESRDTQTSLSVMCFTTLVLCSPLFFVALIPSIIAIPRLPAEIRTVIFEERCERALGFLRRQNDFVAYRDLARYLKTSEVEVNRVLVALLEREQIRGTPYPQYGLFLAHWVMQKKTDELLALVALRGQISFVDLTKEFRIPQEILEDWLAAAVTNGEFSGYVHWEERTLYSEEAEALRDVGCCPKCGGELRMVGKGVIGCAHCGHDIFLEKTTRKKRAKTARPKNRSAEQSGDVTVQPGRNSAA